jgi:hypothetical protein
MEETKKRRRDDGVGKKLSNRWISNWKEWQKVGSYEALETSENRGKMIRLALLKNSNSEWRLKLWPFRCIHLCGIKMKLKMFLKANLSSL